MLIVFLIPTQTDFFVSRQLCQTVLSYHLWPSVLHMREISRKDLLPGTVNKTWSGHTRVEHRPQSSFQNLLFMHPVYGSVYYFDNS